MPEQIRYRVSRPEEPVTTISVLATKNIVNAAGNYDEIQQPNKLYNIGVYGVRGVATIQPAPDDDAYRIIFPLTKFGQRRRDDYRLNDIANTMRTLTALERAAKLLIPDLTDTASIPDATDAADTVGAIDVEDQLRTLSFDSSQTLFSDGRMHLSTKIMKPPYSDEYVIHAATDSMRQVARAIRYDHYPEWSKAMNEKHLEGNVYAYYQRQYGATLETNPMGGCSIGTDGMWYEENDPRMELTAHNLYSPEQQLICLAGAFAIGECAEG